MAKVFRDSDAFWFEAMDRHGDFNTYGPFSSRTEAKEWGEKFETREQDADNQALEEDALRNMGLDDAVDFGLEDVGCK